MDNGCKNIFATDLHYSVISRLKNKRNPEIEKPCRAPNGGNLSTVMEGDNSDGFRRFIIGRGDPRGGE